MNTYIKTLLLLLLPLNLLAQPGYHIAFENLSDIDSAKAADYCLDPSYYRLTIILDNNANYDNLKYFKNAKSLKIKTRGITKIPKAFYHSAITELKGITIHSDDSLLTDISVLGEFRALNGITISNYSGENLPKSFEHLDSLNGISIEGIKLKKIDVLTKNKLLEWIILKSDSLMSFPLFPEDNQLNGIDITANNLHDIKNLHSLQKLEGLHLRNIPIQKLPTNLSKNLKSIYLHGLYNLKDISSLTLYKELKYLTILNTSLEKFDVDLSELKKLSSLELSGDELIDISGIGSLHRIEKLFLKELPKLQSIDGFDMSKCSFEEITLYRLNQLNNINALVTCRSLIRLELTELSIEEIPKGFSNLTNLKYFRISSDSLKSISHLKNMQKLSAFILGTKNEKMNDFSVLKTNTALRDIDFSISKINSLNWVVSLKKIEKLEIRSPNSTIQIPEDISRCSKLDIIILSACIKDLTPIVSLGKINILSIDTNGCLEKIPEEINKNNYKSFWVK
jgi:Leucine-rich repeat (LRR) protein